MSIGLWIAVAAVVVALAFGTYRALSGGRFRGRSSAAERRGTRQTAAQTAAGEPTSADPTTWETVGPASGGVAPGERATLVQFSSAFCAPCRSTRRVLADVADAVPGIVHVDIDAEQHLDVVRRLGILRTPTTLILDGAGNEVARAAGAPRREQVLSALPGVSPAS